MRSSRLFWALILILLGLLFLGNNLGVININVWTLIWPLFLILLGVWFLLGNLWGPKDIPAEEASIPLGDAEEARVVVKHGVGRLSVDDSAEEGMLASGRFANGLEPEIRTTGSRLDVVMKPHSSFWLAPWNWPAARGLQWDFGLNPRIPLDLTFETGAAETHLNLESLQVKNLVLTTGASSTEITMPAQAGMTRVKVEAGAASVKFRIPEGVSARIEAEAGLASVEVDTARFPGSGKFYQSADYDTAENKIHFQIETGMAAIEIR